MQSNLSDKKFVLLLMFCLCLPVSLVFADDLAHNNLPSETSAETVAVRIRTIRASQQVDASFFQNPVASPKVEIDDRLSDLGAKLRQLHFRRFRLVSNDEVEVPLKKKEIVNLTEKTVLSLRPLYLDDDRVGMWIKWTDKSGQQVLLDTRMHFDSEESMLTGTDSKEDGGLILAINARRKK